MLDLALIPATAGRDFPPLRLRRIPREARKSLPAALHCVPAPSGCGSIASGLSTAIEVAMGAARQTKRNETNGDHRHLHHHRERLHRRDQDLNLNVKARIERVETPSEKGPQFRIFSGTSSWARLGRRRPRAPSATTSRSSWTTRASPPRSTPPWSGWKAKKASSSSGPARWPGTDRPDERAPPQGGAPCLQD